MKKLLTAICAFALAACLFGTSTFAWFSMNKTVEAKGLKVTAKSDSSLVIADAAVPGSSTGTITIDYNMSTAQELFDSTHDLTVTGTTLNYGSGLKNVSNPADVDPESGKAASGKTLTFVNAANNLNSNGKYYYIDKYVGIAAAGTAMTGKDIQITLWNAGAASGKEGEALQDINGAISVDFYVVKTTAAAGTTIDDKVVTVGTTTYVGTLNLAHHTNSDTAAKTAATDTLLATDGTSGFTIPVAGDTSASSTGIAVLMRIYVDGALQYIAGSDAGKTYINNLKATSIASKSIQVKFEAVDHVSK